MLCQSNGQLCLQGHNNSNGEFEYDYTNGIVDYIARSSQLNYGVVRNQADGPNTLRCFSNANAYCTAPSNTGYFPEGVPLIFDVNVVPLSTELTAENSDGTPRAVVPGAVDFSNHQDNLFGVVSMDPTTCAQQYEGQVGVHDWVTYVQQVPFGGNVGTQDALVIDEIELAYNGTTRVPSGDHIERYFYVKGLGRVREASSGFDTNTGYYDEPLGGNSVRNIITANTISNPQVLCPQGTAPLN